MTIEERQAMHDLWFSSGIVSIELLSDWNDHKKTELLHYFVETKITKDFQEFFESAPALCSYGAFPEFDTQLADGTTVELKISSHEGNSVFVETAKNSQGWWVQSGLTLSQADYYIFLQPGIVQKDGPVVMKVRILPTTELRSLHQILKIREYNNSRGFQLEFGSLANDGWVGSYPYYSDTKQFDTKSPTIAHTNIKKMKKSKVPKGT